MPFKDLREFIEKLESEGEVQKIAEEVDWNLEAGAMLRRACEAGLPAPFFQKVKGYPDGFRLFGGSAANYKRLAIAMDMDPATGEKDLIGEFVNRKSKPIKPVLSRNGPCKENVLIGDKVDLLKFPVPLIHQDDGGRYLGTWHITICRDNESEWVNWSMNRHMLHNKNTCGIAAGPPTHLGGLYALNYEPKNKPMEVAIVIGAEPASIIAAVSQAPHGVSEVDIAGGVRGKPVELVKCETVDLAVPASAEIVVEGEILPHERMDEGPFGEWTGYMAGVKTPKPVIHVKAVTHRNNPIFTMSCLGTPVDDCLLWTFSKEVSIVEALTARGLPVTGACMPVETCSFLVVVAVKTIYANVAEEVAHAIWNTNHGRSIPYIVVVNDDVDPHDIKQWLHALVSKCHPRRGINVFDNTTASLLIPFLAKNERRFGIGTKAYFDCTWPVNWDAQDIPKRMSFAESYPSDIKQNALEKWGRYGY